MSNMTFADSQKLETRDQVRAALAAGLYIRTSNCWYRGNSPVERWNYDTHMWLTTRWEPTKLPEKIRSLWTVHLTGPNGEKAYRFQPNPKKVTRSSLLNIDWITQDTVIDVCVGDEVEGSVAAEVMRNGGRVSDNTSVWELRKVKEGDPRVGQTLVHVFNDFTYPREWFVPGASTLREWKQDCSKTYIVDRIGWAPESQYQVGTALTTTEDIQRALLEGWVIRGIEPGGTEHYWRKLPKLPLETIGIERDWEPTQTLTPDMSWKWDVFGD